MDERTANALMNAKSSGMAVFLTLFFGGIGLFYASTVGGIVMSIIEVILVVLVFVTLGFGVVLVPIFHIICLIWAMAAVKNYNQSLLQSGAGR